MSASRASPAPAPGLVVGSRYRLESVLGEGGMAVVWAAVHTETDRRVALKLVKADFVRDEVVRDLFVREARVAARIGKSDYIVDVLDAGVDAALEVPFIAMELLEGQGLDRLIRKGPISRQLVADLLEQLGEALEQAHGAGVFHRDLKPQNLFIIQDRKGKPLLKVVDFGIAKLADAQQQSTTHVGTPAYSAPEQLGDSWRTIAKQQSKTIASRVSAGTDVWALGLVAFEMLTGASPGAFWGAKTLAELPVKMVLEPLPSASTRADPALLPLHFDAWLARCLDLDAERRWPSAREAVQALLPALRAPSRMPSGSPLAVSVAVSSPPAGAAPQSPPPGTAPPARRAPHGPPPGTAPPAPKGPPPGTAPPAPPAAHGPPPGTAPPPGGRWTGPTTGYPHPSHAPSHPSHAPSHPHAPPVVVDPRVLAWVTRWRAELRTPGDVRAFLAWPVAYMPRVELVSREARVTVQGALVTIGEVVVDDAMRKAIGEDRMLIAMVQTPRLGGCRAAVRSKRSSGGVVDGVSRGLKALDALLISAPPAGLLRDPHFEQQFEVWAPTPHEAHAAIPVSLRQALVSAGFHGILERFPGALLITAFDALRFDPPPLDRLLDLCARVLGAIP